MDEYNRLLLLGFIMSALVFFSVWLERVASVGL